MNFKSNGKLLITGEYIVLNGALSLALPTQLGQSLQVEYTTDKRIHWESYNADDKLWFWAKYTLNGIDIIDTSNLQKAHLLSRFIRCCKDLNTNFLSNTEGIKVNTHLEFNRKWGLGSSSTLINNLAQWANVNAFEILKKCFRGSGYDIACAKHNSPIFYQLKQGKPVYKTTQIDDALKPHLYFVYLNKKQNSRDAIFNYLNKSNNLPSYQISKITQISKDISTVKHLSDFEQLVIQHENILSEILDTRTVQKSLFNDYKLGVIKSLGAWGGDFIMATSQTDPSSYFKSNGYNTILKYCDLIKEG